VTIATQSQLFDCNIITKVIETNYTIQLAMHVTLGLETNCFILGTATISM